MDASPSRFRLDALEARLAPLDALPRTLWLPTIVNNEGGPVARLHWVARARARLLQGASPLPEDDPLRPDLAEAFGPVIDRLGLADLSSGQPAVADEVLRSLLWHVDQVARLGDTLARPDALARLAAAFAAEWTARGQALHEVMRLVESLDGMVAAARWSTLRGVLESDGWRAILAARDRIERMPGLMALIRRLGRARPRDDERPQAVDEVGGPGPLPWVREERRMAVPGAPVEVEGVRRSAELATVLPTEFAWRSGGSAPLRARALRRLFAARLAEQGLLSWEHRTVHAETTWVRRPGPARSPHPVPRPQAERGPIVVCVDTSASMSGGPEQVAKAIVVEALRTASHERRRCHLIAFSGAGQVAECELAPDVDGLLELARFVSAGFRGGTDVVEPIERALARVHEAGWHEADLLIASDGEFGPTAATVAAVQAARARLGLRVVGVLIGDRETRGMRSIVDETFWVRDWRRWGDRHGQVDTPVHDRNLTALYFPNMAAAAGTGTPLPGMPAGGTAPGAAAASGTGPVDD